MINRETIETRYGELGTGSFELNINGRSYDLYELLHILGHAFDDIRPIDACALPEKTYAIRYCCLEDRHIVTVEFDQGFQLVAEHRAHLAEWMGEEEYQTFGWGAWCPWSI